MSTGPKSEIRVRLLPVARVDARVELRRLCVTMVRDPGAARDVGGLLARVVLEFLDAEGAAGL